MTRLFALRQVSLFLLLVFAQPLAAIAQSDVWSADLESRVAAEMSRLVAAGRISGGKPRCAPRVSRGTLQDVMHTP